MPKKALNEAERYGFPIIITASDGTVFRNAEAKRTRSLSRTDPLAKLDKKTVEKVSRLEESSAVIVKFKTPKNGSALVLRRFGLLFFMYLPMLDNIVSIPREIFTIYATGKNLSELLSSLASKLFPKNEVYASSFARICSIAATLSFSEDTVKHELDGDGLIDPKSALSAFGRALGELDTRDATELSDPPILISFSEGGISLSLYGYEIWRERSAVLSAVSPYSFTEKEYSQAFELALVISIFKSRKEI